MDPEGDGVHVVDLAPECEGETASAQIVGEMKARGLKYDPPDISTLENKKPTPEMIDLLSSYIDESLMSDDVRTSWTEIMMEQNS